MSLARSQAAAPFQMHSHDYLLRVGRSELDAIVFSHLCTVQDPGVLEDTAWASQARLRAGYTEWQGGHAGCVVSLAWDWVELCDGALHPVTVVAPRSNLRLLDAKGYDLASAEEAQALWARIAEIGWRGEALRGLSRMVDGASDAGPGAPHA